MIEFETLWFLVALPIPLAVYFLLPAVSQQQAALRVPFLDRLEQLQTGTLDNRPNNLPILLLAVTWVCLTISLCRPVIIGDPVQLPTEARDLMLAVDISGSMDESDMRIGNKVAKRVDSVKHVVGEFTRRRSGDRVGLILFADQAYLQAPLTFDTETVTQLLNEAQLGFAGQKTAIGDAIGLAVKRLSDRPAESRVLILLTDGANNAGAVPPNEAAQYALENDITIHTIGIGADVIVERSIFGSTRRNPSRDLDERSLKKIASLTGGQYFRAKDVAELENIYQALDQLEPVDQDAEIFRPKKQLFYWPLGIAMSIASLLALQQFFRR